MTEFLLRVAWEVWSILKEASIFLLLGFALAGVLAVLVPPGLLTRLLGRGKVRSVLWGSAIGTPLPLCSCGVLPTAIALKRQGATRGATVSFLISTPEIGVDSIAVTYALMDPIMTVARPVAAFGTAFAAGIATNLWGGDAPAAGPPEAAGEGSPDRPSDGAPSADDRPPRIGPARLDGPWAGRARARTGQVFRYAFRELLDETAYWLLLGVVLAALVAVLIPASFIERYLGGGLGTMLLMLVIGIPLYTCASATTPVAAALVLKGLSPGAALVLLLSGPATNLGSIVVLLKFLGRRVVAIYLATIAIVSLLAGYAVDWIYRAWRLDPVATFGEASTFVPEPLKVAAALVMAGLLTASVRRTPVPEEWLQLRDRLAALTGLRLTARGIAGATACLLAALWLSSGVFTVRTGEVALQTRFGRLVAADLGPGLHVRWPWPIEAHRTVERDRVRRIEVGFRSEPQATGGVSVPAQAPLTVAGPSNPVPATAWLGFWSQKARVEQESFWLSGDQNILDIAATAQYRVIDPVAYAYHVADPETVVRQALIAALRAIVATTSVDALYTTARRDVEARAALDAQALLDGYRSGVGIVAVSLLSVHAPDEVHAAFRDVASAHEDKIHTVERARTFALEGVNLAQGDAAAMIEAAGAFRLRRVLEAQGDALAFSLREREYRRAPDLTRFRLQVETVEQVLPSVPKILRPGPPDVQGIDLWLLRPFGAREGR